MLPKGDGFHNSSDSWQFNPQNLVSSLLAQHLLTASNELPQALLEFSFWNGTDWVSKAKQGLTIWGRLPKQANHRGNTWNWMKTLGWQGDKPLLLVFPLFLNMGVQKAGLIYQLLPLFAAFSTRCKVGMGNNWGRNCCDGKEELPPSMASFLKWHSGEIHPDHPWKTPAADSKTVDQIQIPRQPMSVDGDNPSPKI